MKQAGTNIRLNFVPPSFRDDKEIVLQAVGDSYEEYLYVSDRLKQDKDVIRTTLKNTPKFYIVDVLRWMDYKTNPLFKDEKFLLELIKENPHIFFEIDLAYRKDKKFMLEAIKINHNFYNYADYSLKEPTLYADGNIKRYWFIENAIDANPAVRYLDIPKEVAKSPYQIEPRAGKRVTIKHPYLPLLLTFININKYTLLEFKENLKQVTSLIKKSKIPKFSKVLKDNIYIANKENLKKYFLLEGLDDTSALYSKNLDDIFYVMPSKSSSIYDLVHEFGHKFQNTMIKDGMENEAISSFFMKLQNDTCSMPKLGDPLSDLREDWWNVKMSSSNEFYLNEIDRNKNYIYKNDQGVEKTISSDKMKELMVCPSKYGASNVQEFFAEMVALITLGKVKPNQQWIADKLIKIIKDNLEL